MSLWQGCVEIKVGGSTQLALSASGGRCRLGNPGPSSGKYDRDEVHLGTPHPRFPGCLSLCVLTVSLAQVLLDRQGR